MSILVAGLVVIVLVTALGAFAMTRSSIPDGFSQSDVDRGRPHDSWGSMASGMMGRLDARGEPEYLAEMVAHHEEAVDAARQLARSDRPEMRRFGESIVETQSAQIQQMRTWLRAWYPGHQRDADGYRPMMRDLSGLSGDELDEVFLREMIGHHMVAVMWSQQLLWGGGVHEQVAELARTIRDDQHAEIVDMQRWLAQWFDWRDMGPGAMR
ncbi:DUF305 domain-containing protein [Jiangella mangrovi]|uniref:Uncharacterized protein (DUF305 family) n=1 Tax=Jiangella mangrovi TaxID=1524084 RepID=A0A7W9GS81_9ACTN|nr:DUF305 domain-containing protein [Jiangella mangrovi]MBB5788766.1 uncharacterized protein (DUF305 family) [Jiangella mangrovi]